LFAMFFLLLQHSTGTRWSDYPCDYHETLHWKPPEDVAGTVCGKKTHLCCDHYLLLMLWPDVVSSLFCRCGGRVRCIIYRPRSSNVPS